MVRIGARVFLAYIAAMHDSSIEAGFVAVKAAIAAAAQRAGRTADEIALVAVSKQQDEAKIAAALALGHRLFGENRVQEAQMRWSARRGSLPDLELRLIGPLQSNKTREAVDLFDVIETVDRDKLAAQLRAEIDRAGKAPRLYVQVNVGEEPQKAGIGPHAVDAFLDRLRGEYGLAIDGLMCIPPAGEAAGLYFALLREMARRNGLARLSMGMSADFREAIRFGATSVRVGSALFGERV